MGRSSRPEVPRLGEVLGDGGQLAPCPPTRRSGGAVSLHGVRGEAPAEIDFCVFLIQQTSSSTTILAITGV